MGDRPPLPTAEGGHYPPATLGEGEGPPQGCSRWLAGLPLAHPAASAGRGLQDHPLPAPRATTGRNQGPEGSRRGLALCPGCPRRAQPAKQAQPSPDARRTSQAFFPGSVPGAALDAWHRPCSVTPTPSLGGRGQPGAKGLPHAVPRRLAHRRDTPARDPSARLARLPPDYGNEVKASSGPANSRQVSSRKRDGMRLGSCLKAICSWRCQEQAAALGEMLPRGEILPHRRAGSIPGLGALRPPGTGRGRWVLRRTLPTLCTANTPGPHLPTNSPKNTTAGPSLPKTQRDTLGWRIGSPGRRLKHR